MANNVEGSNCKNNNEYRGSFLLNKTYKSYGEQAIAIGLADEARAMDYVNNRLNAAREEYNNIHYN